MYCKVIRIRSENKWAIAFYDHEYQRTDRPVEFFDRELDAMNRVAELMALENYNYIGKKG